MSGTDGPGADGSEDRTDASGPEESAGGPSSSSGGGEAATPRDGVTDPAGPTERPDAVPSTLRSRFGALASTWPRRVGVGVAGLVGLLAVLTVAGVVGAPSVALVDEGDWGEVTDERTEIVTTVEVRNPNPLGVSLGKRVVVDYDIAMNDVLVAEGSKSNVSIPAGTSRTRLRTDMYNERLPAWWVQFVRDDETVVVNATATLRVDALVSTSHEVPVNRTMLGNRTPVVDALSAAVNSTAGTYTRSVDVGQIEDALFGGGGDSTVAVGYEIRRGWATWDAVTRNETTVVFHLDVYNPGDVPVPATPDGVGVAVDANDVRLFEAQGDEISLRSVGPDALIQPGESRVVNFSVTMDNERVDEWFTSHVRSDAGPGQEATAVSSQFQVVFENPATGTTFRLPSDSPVTYDCEFETAILVDDRNATSTCGRPTGPAT